MDIFITGVTGMGNRGVEALVAPIVQHVHTLYPNDRIRVLSRDWRDDARRGSGLPCVFEPDQFHAIRTRAGRAKDFVDELTPGKRGRLAKLSEEIRKAKLVISTGGDVFSADYGTQRLHLEPLEQALRGKVPVVMLAHSVGPYKSDGERQMWADVASKCTLVTIREQLSYDYVTSAIGLKSDRVRLTADVAFTLQPASAARSESLLRYYGIDPSKPFIACAISRGISRFKGLSSSSEQTSKVHRAAWGAALKWLTHELGVQVLLVPHVQDSGMNEDRLYDHELLDDVGFDSRIRVAWGDLRAGEYKGLISRADLVVAERMHAGIAGLSSATPTLLVKYSVKAEGVLRDLLGDEASLRQAMVLLEDFLDPNKAIQSIRTAWDARSQLRAKLEAALPRTKELAESNFRMMKELVP